MTKRKTLIGTLLEKAAAGLTVESLKETAAEYRLPLSRVAGVASFYSRLNGLGDGEADMRFAEGGLEGAMFAPADYDLILDCAEHPDDILKKVRDFGLKGRGGSEYPVADKWESVKNADGKEKYVICNGSEGEGETYKDMKLMLKAPHAILEGMLLCAAAVGSKKGYIYVRAEYPECKRSMEEAVKSARLGGFEVEVFESAGAYVCGEETALIRSVEGFRAEPALKPPYPSAAGLFGCPTVINNAESFAAVSELFISGKITKLFTVSGCVEKPGVYELPYGTTAAELADIALGRSIKGFRLGGAAAGRIYGLKDLNMKLDSELGTAGVRFFDEETNVRALCAESVLFLSGQSCGKCVPCRLGSVRLLSLLNKNGELSEIHRLCSYLKNSSRCAFGQSIPNCVESAMDAFPADFMG